MKKWITIALVFVSVLGFAELVNWVVAKVGSYTITYYDLKRMESFLKLSGDPNSDEKAAFKELLFTYSLFAMAEKDAKLRIQSQELDKYIAMLTNVTNAQDIAGQYRNKLYKEYPQEFVLQLKKNQMIRGLVFYDEGLKAQASKEPTENEKRAYYEENKKMFMKPPLLDIIVFAAMPPTSLTLDQLEAFEKNFAGIAERLRESDDVDAIFRDYNYINFEPYSGRTGYKSAYDLLKTGMYPEEVLGIPFQDSIPLPTGTITVKEGKVIHFPQPIPLRSKKKSVYLVIKVLKRDALTAIPYEDVKNDLGLRLKDMKIMQAIQDYVVKKAKKGDIRLNLLDNNYSGDFNAFVGR